ncbi:ATP-binding protein [Herbaspirillum robiniae]|uniref:DNA-binding protein n=1 Tax=Herbaspirillum robiniae TaxID=2014887 RepID=A0ABX2LYG4_9BURK|nr:ATP-binding protein [Herbaspirillum robiniae]NUU03515.1 DNA-binding protein [Herbaspirillum robiniae]
MTTMSNVIKLGEAEAAYLCEREENDYFDRKSARIKPVQVQDIAVAFANAEGGTVVIGIEDSGTSTESKSLERWVGRSHIEEYNEIIQTVAGLNPGIDFQHSFLYHGEGYANRYVLKLDVRRSLKVHETSKGSVLLRRGAQSITLKGSQIPDLMRAKGMISEEDTYLPSVSPERIVDGKNLADFLASLPLTDKEPLSFVLQENLVESKSLAPTVAAVLLFAENPSALMPKQCALRIVRYDSSHEEIERDKLTGDMHSIEAPLQKLITDAFRKLKEVIARSECWTPEGLKSPMYPDDALYEVLVNSVLHRDYGISDNVLISVYRNRIEFRSPGRLPGFVTTENIQHARFSRNPKLVRLLSKYTNAPNKDLGEGINTVYERMQQAGFVDPVFIDDGANLHVILKRRPREDSADVITRFIHRHGSINNRQAIDLLALESADQATAIFSKLREQGTIAREDEKQTGTRVRWILGK